jgi:DNA-binding CsgD family transcriptional regulator
MPYNIFCMKISTPGTDTKRGLSPRERQILKLISVVGHTKGVAEQLGISSRTVEHHLARARQKLGCDTTFQAIALVQEVHPPTPSAPASIAPAELNRKPRQGAIASVAVAAVLICAASVLLWIRFAGASTASIRSKELSVAIIPTASKTDPKTLAARASLLTAFDESFDWPTLDPDWRLTDGVGDCTLLRGSESLRYKLTNGTEHGDREAKWLFRHFRGRVWQLQAKVRYTLPPASGRQIVFGIVFGPTMDDRSHRVVYSLNREATGPPQLGTLGYDGDTVWGGQLPLSTSPNTLYLRITRIRQDISLSISEDGDHYDPCFTVHDYRSPLSDVQAVCLSASCFNDKAATAAGGSWLDVEYVKLIPTDQ